MALGRLTEVIPSRLWWGPEVEAGEAWSIKDKVPLAATELIEKSGANYAVPHYAPAAVGRAFGPISLEKTLEFCAELFNTLGQEAGGEGRCMVLVTPPKNSQMRTNVATMLGIYLVLRHQWDISKVQQVLGERDAMRTFACSWARKGKKEEKRHHRVYDCWAAIQLAKQLEWISGSVISDSQRRQDFCKRAKLWSAVYDGAWIVPGRIVVCADPSTTASDPNPATFQHIFPGGDDGTGSTPLTSAATSRATSKERCMPPSSTASSRAGSKTAARPMQAAGKIDEETEELPAPRRQSSLPSLLSSLEYREEGSCDTVCKDYYTANVWASEQMDMEGSDMTPDFVTHLRANGVKVMIRCNFDNEPGMPRQTYTSEGMKNNGIDHCDLIVPDYDGGLPTRSGVRHAIDLVSDVLSSQDYPNAVAVHCKGGFGRSVVLACCLAIDKYDLRGDALMAWVRMARPGAITSHLQEKFLKQLTGRRALRKWAGLPQECDDGPGHPPQPKCVGCSLM